MALPANQVLIGAVTAMHFGDTIARLSVIGYVGAGVAISSPDAAIGADSDVRPVCLQTSEYPDPRVVTPRPLASSIQPNSFNICWL